MNHGFWPLSIPLAAALLHSYLGLTSRPAPLPKGESETMLSCDAFPDKQDYILNERIRLTVHIQNQGPDAVEIADPEHPASDQPSIGLIGPAFPEGKLAARSGY